MGDTEVLAAGKPVKTKKPVVIKHSITLHFTEAEDIQLYDLLVERAREDFRRPLPQYVLLALHTAFKSQMYPETGPGSLAEPTK